jgi:glycosyltransferase involved in cell wall biosynthesis
MSKAKAFVYAACEDFGMALVEAQACGTPAIAYGAGGALETVRDIRQHPEAGTGLFFAVQRPEALIEAVETFEASSGSFNPEIARLNAAQFAPDIFKNRYLAFLERCYQEFYSAKSLPKI